MIGTAWPSESTRRSAVGFHGSFGSHRICLYISTATRWASDSAVDGCPLPAAVVISTESFPISTAFLCTAASKLMADSVLADVWRDGRGSRAPRHCILAEAGEECSEDGGANTIGMRSRPRPG